MKTLLPTLMFFVALSCIFSAKAQTAGQSQVSIDEPFDYIFLVDYMVKGYDFVQNKTNDAVSQIALANSRFRVEKYVKGDDGTTNYLVIKFLPHSKSSDYTENKNKVIGLEIKAAEFKLDPATNADKIEENTRELDEARKRLDTIKKWEDNYESRYVSNDNNGEYFYINTIDFNDPLYVKKRYIINSQFTLGSLVLPIKIRPSLGGALNKPFNYTTDVTLSGSFGLKFRMSHYKPTYFNLVGTFGLTTVNVDSSSTRGYINVQNNQMAITPAIGFIFMYNDFQIGLVMGGDFIGGDIGNNWIYNKRLWYSLGIGYQFLKPKE